MSILTELNTLFSPVLPVETGVFSGVPPDEYLVFIGVKAMNTNSISHVFFN